MSTSSSSKSKQALASQQILHFYKNDQLATEVAVSGNRHVLLANDVALAQFDKSQPAKMLRVDLANSVLGLASEAMAYSPYGYLAPEKMKALLQFNGQWCDPFTEGYHLGQGRRVYSPRRMRFCSDDPLSPFGKGGPHPSAYCEGDPVNRYDPTGQFFQFIKALPNRAASLVLTNFGRSINFATSGISRNPTTIDPRLQKTYSAARNFKHISTGPLYTNQAIPLPALNPSHSKNPATPSSFTKTETAAHIPDRASRPGTQERQMPTQTWSYPGEIYRRSPAQMAVQHVLGIGLGLGIAAAIIAIFVVAIRHGAKHKD
ncbi:RHS repeat-associated core domain-containing protein [Pseudomonas parafulva]|uniref:RHS repeat-associated core domain-containing protein n=1 Tax=Pseudomonas parafulva TaxID=157782 RepID=UPI000AFC672D|nr:RHS repeat-associated core domain-containing protein [Pseudomonas parafulva]